MAAVQLITLSTSLLDFYFEAVGLNSIGDDDAKRDLKTFQNEIIKAREKAMPSEVRIRWEAEEDAYNVVKEFAQEQNRLINL